MVAHPRPHPTRPPRDWYRRRGTHQPLLGSGSFALSLSWVPAAVSTTLERQISDNGLLSILIQIKQPNPPSPCRSQLDQGPIRPRRCVARRYLDQPGNGHRSGPRWPAEGSGNSPSVTLAYRRVTCVLAITLSTQKLYQKEGDMAEGVE